MEQLKAGWRRFSAGLVWRAWQRYSNANGGLLAGGVTYFAFFSLFPAVALAFTVFGLVLRGRPGLLEDVRAAIDNQLPGFVQNEDGTGGLIPIAIPSGSTLGLTALIGVVGLLWAGLGWLGALRQGIRAIFGVPVGAGNFVFRKLRDLGVLLTLGVGVVLVAIVTTVTNSVATTAAAAIGLGDQGWVVTVAGLVAAILANTALVALMLRVLTGVDLPWPALRNGAAFGGIAMTVLQTFGTRLIAGTMNNRLFASIALVVGLLAFLNLIARAMLMSAAWAANDLDAAASRMTTVSDGERAKLMEGPQTRAHAGAERPPESLLPQDPQTRAALGLPTLDPRAADRVSVASGAVLGAAGMAFAGLATRVGRTLVRRR